MCMHGGSPRVLSASAWFRRHERGRVYLVWKVCSRYHQCFAPPYYIEQRWSRVWSAKMSEDSAIDDSATSNFSDKEGPQNIIAIRGRVVLDCMLEHFGMPAAQYKQDIQPDNRICVSVTFQTPVLSSHRPPVVMTTTGVESLDGALAEHTAAVSTIILVEAATNTVIGHMRYGHLRQLDRENSHLRKQVELSKQLLKRTNIKAKKLARGWFCLLEGCFLSHHSFTTSHSLPTLVRKSLYTTTSRQLSQPYTKLRYRWNSRAETWRTSLRI